MHGRIVGAGAGRSLPGRCRRPNCVLEAASPENARVVVDPLGETSARAVSRLPRALFFPVPDRNVIAGEVAFGRLREGYGDGGTGGHGGARHVLMTASESWTLEPDPARTT